jgi:hypothetical protein
MFIYWILSYSDNIRSPQVTHTSIPSIQVRFSWDFPQTHRPLVGNGSIRLSAGWRILEAAICIRILHMTPRDVILSFCYFLFERRVDFNHLEIHALLRAFIVSTRLENVFTAV